MVRKKVISIICVLMLSYMLTNVCNAYNGLYYWYSNVSTVGYSPMGASYWKINYSSSFQSNFNAAVSNASSQWGNTLPFTPYETYGPPAMKLFGGTYSQLKTEFPNLKPESGGQAISYKTLYTYTNYVDMIIYVYKQSVGGKACVVQKSGQTTNQYKMIMTHELGHLLGWDGHSSNSSDIMYSNVSSITTLTPRDKNHLTQIYDLFY